MAYETPVARELRLEKERADAREKRGVFTRKTIADKYKQGEITFEQLIGAINNGKVWEEPLPPRNPNASWDEIENRIVINPFERLRLTPEQDKQIRLAWSGYYDDGDPANAVPMRFNLPMPNYDDTP